MRLGLPVKLLEDPGNKIQPRQEESSVSTPAPNVAALW